MPKLTINMNDEVKTVLEDSSKRNGVSKSAYISTLIMQKNIEYQTAKLMQNLTPDQIKKAVEQQMKIE